jgi:hypothetical protein
MGEENAADLTLQTSYQTKTYRVARKEVKNKNSGSFCIFQ